MEADLMEADLIEADLMEANRISFQWPEGSLGRPVLEARPWGG